MCNLQRFRFFQVYKRPFRFQNKYKKVVIAVCVVKYGVKLNLCSQIAPLLRGLAIL